MKLLQLLEYELNYKNKLNPKLWNDGQLIGDVRSKLLQISNEFLKSLKIDNSFLVDAVITGSNCNYNWNNESDIDLHLVLSYSSFSQSCAIADVATMFKAHKTAWNEGHDIKIYDIPVECYVEDADLARSHANSSKYSIIKNEWITEPKFIKNIKVDDVAIDSMYKTLSKTINDVLEAGELETIKKLSASLADMRTSYLENGGEFSTGNLVYKKLRKSGMLKKLWDKSKKLENKKLSLK